MNIRTKEFNIGGVVIPNPIVVASCPATEDRERLLKCSEAGAGAAILKSCHTIEKIPVDQGFRRFQHSARGLWGTSTVARELLHPEKVCVLLDEVKKSCDLVVIPSVAGFSLELSEWLNTLRLLEQYSPPCVQLDLFYLEDDLSMPVNQVRLRELMHSLHEKCTLRLLPKLNQELRPGAAVEVFEETGISGWSVLDSIRTHLPRTGILPLADFPTFNCSEGIDTASLFGSWQLPLVCEYLYRLKTASHLPILAGGGVNNAADVMQLLSLDADAVQVASAILRFGPDWIKRTIEELEYYRPDELERFSVQRVQKKILVQIDRSLCTSCGCCSKQLMCTAVEMGEKGPIVNHEKCEGCGFCLDLCQARAMSLSVVNSKDHQNSAFKVEGIPRDQ